MIKNGHAYTVENGYNDTALISDASESVQQKVRAWILAYLKPSYSPFNEKDSCDLNDLLRETTGIDITHNQFKDAMLREWYVPVKSDIPKWNYCISERSPILFDETVIKLKLKLAKELSRKVIGE